MIRVTDHDPAWAGQFARLRGVYEAALGVAGVPFLAVEHVGSTAVPGLAAKPVIDVDIVVAAGDVAAASQVLVGLGFTPRGEHGVPQRWAFRAPDDLPPTHTYVVVDGSLALRNHLVVREILRVDAGLRAEYAAVKRDLAARCEDVDAYVMGRSAVLQRVLAAGGLTADERRAVEGHQQPSSDGS